jgi:AbrB family looped-hinge helix DNA binding protein
MQFTSNVTSKGQVTLPAKLRKQLGIKASDQVSFVAKGKTIQVSKSNSIEELFGTLHNPKITPLSTKEMKQMTQDQLFRNDKDR